MPVPVFEVPTSLYAPAAVIGGRTPRQALILLLGGVMGGVCVLVPFVLRWPVPTWAEPLLHLPLPLTLVPASALFLSGLVLQIEDWDGLPMLTWVCLAWRYWRMPKEMLRSELGQTPGRRAIQEHVMNIDRITQGGVIGPDGRRAVLELDRLPSLGMATEDEQLDQVQRYARWLNGLHGRVDRIQELLIAGDENTRRHVEAKQARRYPRLHEEMRQYGDGYDRLITELGQGLLHRSHYVVVPEPISSDVALDDLAHDVERGISRLGIKPLVVSASRMRQLLRNQWRAGFDRPERRMILNWPNQDTHAAIQT